MARRNRKTRRPRSRPAVFLHRVIRAVRALIEAFRTSGSGGAHRPGPGKAGLEHKPNGRGGPRPTVWPWCTSCSRRVAALCEMECGVCSACCQGHPHHQPHQADHQDRQPGHQAHHLEPLDGSDGDDHDALGGDREQ